MLLLITLAYVSQAYETKLDGKVLKKLVAESVSKFEPVFDSPTPIIPPNTYLVTEDKLPDEVTKALASVQQPFKSLMDKLKANQQELSKKSNNISKYYIDWSHLIHDVKLKDCLNNQCFNTSAGQGLLSGIDQAISKYFTKKPQFIWNQLQAIILKHDPNLKTEVLFTRNQGCIFVSYSFSQNYGWPYPPEKTMNCLMESLVLPEEDLGCGITLAQKFKFEPLKRNDCDALINHTNKLIKFLNEKGLNVKFHYDIESLLKSEKPSELINRIATISPIWTEVMKDSLEKFNKQYFSDNWKDLAMQIGWKSCIVSHDETIKKGFESEFNNGELRLKWSMRNFGFPSNSNDVFNVMTKMFPTKPVDLGYGLNTSHLKNFNSSVQAIVTSTLKNKFEEANKHLKTNLGFILDFSVDFDSILAQPDFNKIAETFVSFEPFIAKSVVDTIIYGIKGGAHWYWSQQKDWVPSRFKKLHIVYDPQISSDTIKNDTITCQYKFSSQGSPYSIDGWMGVIDHLIGIPRDMKIWGGLEEKHYSQFSWASRKMALHTLKPRVEEFLKLAREMKVEKRRTAGEPIPVIKVTKIKFTDIPSGNRLEFANRIKNLKSLFLVNTSNVIEFDDHNIRSGELRITYKDQQSANAALKKLKDKNELSKLSVGQAPDFLKYSFEIIQKEVHFSQIEKKSDAVGLELKMTFDWDSLLKDSNVDRVLECFTTFERDEPTERVTYGYKMIIDCIMEIYSINYSQLTPKDFYASFCDSIHFIHDTTKKSDDVWHPPPADFSKNGNQLIISYYWGGYGFSNRFGETMQALKKLVKVPTKDPGFNHATGFLKFSGLNLELFGRFSEKSQGFIAGVMKDRVQKTLNHLKESTGVEIEMSIDWNSILDDQACCEKIIEHFATYKRDGVNYQMRAVSHSLRTIIKRYFPNINEFPVKRVHFVNKKGGTPSFTPDPPTFSLANGVLTLTYNMVGWGFPLSDGETVIELLKVMPLPEVDKGYGVTNKVMTYFSDPHANEWFNLYLNRMSKIKGIEVIFDFESLISEPRKEKCLENLACGDFSLFGVVQQTLEEISFESLKFKKILFKHEMNSKLDFVKIIHENNEMILTMNCLNPLSQFTKSQMKEILLK